MYNILAKKGVEYPNFKDINKIVAQTASSLVNSFRYNGSDTLTMNKFLTNMIVYPKINNLSVSLSPILTED